jgi:multidrug efflux pump subunit AcrA (membrane-fusion protein)
MRRLTTLHHGIAVDCNSSRWAYVCFLVAFLFLIGQTEGGFSVERQTGKADSAATPQNAEPQQKNPGTLQFMGLVDVGERQMITLLPGETVDTYFCQQGDFIKKGQPVLKLNNDAIANGIADLILKKNKVKEGIQQLEFAELEKRQKEKQLQRIDGKMDTEKSLKNQVTGYTSPVLQQLETQRLTLLEQMEISTVRIAALKENGTDNEVLLKMIKDQIDDLELRRQNLTVKAPFDARVFFLNPGPGRISPGNMVCELRNESFYLARGKIIQHQRNLIKVGDAVKVALESSPNDAVEGSVQSVEYMQEHREMQGYSAFEAIVRIDARAKWLQAGMMVSISRDGSSLEKN